MLAAVAPAALVPDLAPTHTASNRARETSRKSAPSHFGFLETSEVLHSIGLEMRATGRES